MVKNLLVCQISIVFRETFEIELALYFKGGYERIGTKELRFNKPIRHVVYAGALGRVRPIH